MPVKDYYKILEVTPVASPQEIKRSYRRLAHLYHPDKNTGNPASDSYFREVIEAYEVLSDPTLRESYNYERWSQRYQGKKYDSLAFSPQAILLECITLREHVAGIDIFRMNQQALDYQISEILSTHNLSILAEFKDPISNRKIISALLLAAAPLSLLYAEPLCEKLLALAGADQPSIDMINQYLRQNRRNAYWEKYKMLLTVIAALLLCGLIYLMGK